MGRPRNLALVALGGTLGVAAREGLGLAMAPLSFSEPSFSGMSDAGPLPLAVITANVAGAFLLGLLYGAVSHRRLVHHTTRLGQTMRLLLGVGFCGGFTTYSTFAVGLVLLAGAIDPVQAALWGLGIVVAGALAAWAGMALGGSGSGSGTPGGGNPGPQRVGGNP